MIEIFRIIGSALVAAGATLLSLYLKRKWDKQDKNEDKKNAMEEKIDDLADEVKLLNDKVDRLSTDFKIEVTGRELENSGLQAGLREILYDRIKLLCRKYVSEGKIREEDYNSLQRMWSVYHDKLEGNGFLNKSMEEVEGLERY